MGPHLSRRPLDWFRSLTRRLAFNHVELEKHKIDIKRIIHFEAAVPWLSAMVPEVGWRLQLQTAQLVLAHEEACELRRPST